MAGCVCSPGRFCFWSVRSQQYPVGEYVLSEDASCITHMYICTMLLNFLCACNVNNQRSCCSHFLVRPSGHFSFGCFAKSNVETICDPDRWARKRRPATGIVIPTRLYRLWSWMSHCPRDGEGWSACVCCLSKSQFGTPLIHMQLNTCAWEITISLPHRTVAACHLQIWAFICFVIPEPWSLDWILLFRSCSHQCKANLYLSSFLTVYYLSRGYENCDYCRCDICVWLSHVQTDCPLQL